MSVLWAAAAAWGAAELVRRRAPTRPELGWAAAVAVGSMVLHPLLGTTTAVALLALALRARVVADRLGRQRAEADLPALGELVLMGLTAGLSLAGALELAARHVSPELALEVRKVLRGARRSGLGAALGEANGVARRLYLLLARAQLTGAPSGQAVAAFVHEHRDAERTRRLEAARRLPVRLMVPLALCILPGFVLLTVAPSVLGSLRRLAEPLG
jgi:hypothetical protein